MGGCWSLNTHTHTQPCRVSRLGQFDQWQLKNRGHQHREKTGRVKGKILWVRVLTSFRGCDICDLMMWKLLTVTCCYCTLCNRLTVNLPGQRETESLWLLWSLQKYSLQWCIWCYVGKLTRYRSECHVLLLMFWMFFTGVLHLYEPSRPSFFILLTV